MSSGVDASSARAAMTGCAKGFFLAISAFHSETTRAVLHPGHLHRTLEDLLAGADAEARAAGLDWNLYQHVKYALVALADDLALHTDWDHAEAWAGYLLELRHFNTSFAGQEFFDRLAQIRQQLAGVQDPGLREQVLGALEVYYTALQLGFRGRLRGGSPAEGDGIVNGLYGVLWPGGEKALRQRVWADAYGEGGGGRIVERGRLWWWPIPAATLAAVALWFVFSWSQVGRVGQIVEHVSAVGDGGAPNVPASAPEEAR